MRSLKDYWREAPLDTCKLDYYFNFIPHECDVYASSRSSCHSPFVRQPRSNAVDDSGCSLISYSVPDKGPLDLENICMVHHDLIPAFLAELSLMNAVRGRGVLGKSLTWMEWDTGDDIGLHGEC